MIHMTATALFFLIPTLAVAQLYGPPPPSTDASTTSAAPAIPSAPPSTAGHINIDVAAGGNFVFSPANITAPNGTVVTFFFPNNNGLTHSVTQSSFAQPCTYLAAGSNNTAGFDSGLTLGKQFSINITDDTKPIWFHCKMPLHCGMGMVGSINAPTTGNTHDKFVAAAQAIGSNEQTEQDNGPVTGGFGAIATAPPAASTSGTSGGGGSNNGALQIGTSLAAVVLSVAAFVSLA